MQNNIYEELRDIIDESQMAFHYAEENYEELMSRPVAHVLYGPPSYGPGAVYPSQRVIGAKERILVHQTRRKRYKAYFFDSNWDVLYSRDYGQHGLDCTVLHYWIGMTNYARFFLRDTKDFYSGTIFSVLYTGCKPIRCSFSCSSRVYAEYFVDMEDATGRTLTECTWYDYYPHRIVTKDGIHISKDAPIGAINSPILTGKLIYELNNHLFTNRMEDRR